MAWIAVVPPSPRYPHERYQVCYREGHAAALGWDLPDQAAGGGRTAGHRAWPDGALQVDRPRLGAEGPNLVRRVRGHQVVAGLEGPAPHLRAIEDAAGTIFSGLGLIDEALDVSFPLDDLARLVAMGQVWVASLEDDLPVGMAIASVREGTVYVEEMDVLPAHGRPGLGARLLERVCAWAQEQGYSSVTLSTVRDVPWNGPFYRKHGFRELRPVEWTPGMRAIREQEVRHGLAVEARVFMRRELDEVAPT